MVSLPLFTNTGTPSRRLEFCAVADTVNSCLGQNPVAGTPQKTSHNSIYTKRIFIKLTSTNAATIRRFLLLPPCPRVSPGAIMY